MSIHHVHDNCVWATVHAVAARGFDVACEVGIPKGRVDVAAVDVADNNRLTWLLEVKVGAKPQNAFRQLLRYAEIVGGNPRLTLVVQTAAATAELSRKAEKRGIDVLPLSFRYPRAEVGPGRIINLPTIHPDSAENMRRLLREHARRRWAAEEAAA